MHPKYIFYFHDNKIQFAKDKIIKEHSFPLDTLQYGKIIHIEKFIKNLKQFLKKEKINSFLKSPSILIIMGSNCHNTDKEIILMSLNSANINKIEFHYETDFYPPKKNVTILNIQESYLLSNFNINKKKNYFYPFNIFKNQNQLIKQIISTNKDQSFILFGCNKEIPKYVEMFKKETSNEVHYYNNYSTFIIETAKINYFSPEIFPK